MFSLALLWEFALSILSQFHISSQILKVILKSASAKYSFFWSLTGNWNVIPLVSQTDSSKEDAVRHGAEDSAYLIARIFLPENIEDLWNSAAMKTAGELNKNHWEPKLFSLPCNYPGYLKIPATRTWIVLHSSPTEKLRTKDFRGTGEKPTIESSETITILHIKQITDTFSAKQVFTFTKSTSWSLCHSKLSEPGSLSIQNNYPHHCHSSCVHTWIHTHTHLKQLNSLLISTFVWVWANPNANILLYTLSLYQMDSRVV